MSSPVSLVPQHQYRVCAKMQLLINDNNTVQICLWVYSDGLCCIFSTTGAVQSKACANNQIWMNHNNTALVSLWVYGDILSYIFSS